MACISRNNNEQRIVDFATAKIWCYLQPATRTEIHTNKPGDPGMAKPITIFITYKLQKGCLQAVC